MEEGRIFHRNVDDEKRSERIGEFVVCDAEHLSDTRGGTGGEDTFVRGWLYEHGKPEPEPEPKLNHTKADSPPSCSHHGAIQGKHATQLEMIWIHIA